MKVSRIYSTILSTILLPLLIISHNVEEMEELPTIWDTLFKIRTIHQDQEHQYCSMLEMKDQWRHSTTTQVSWLKHGDHNWTLWLFSLNTDIMASQCLLGTTLSIKQTSSTWPLSKPWWISSSLYNTLRTQQPLIMLPIPPFLCLEVLMEACLLPGSEWSTLTFSRVLLLLAPLFCSSLEQYHPMLTMRLLPDRMVQSTQTVQPSLDRDSKACKMQGTISQCMTRSKKCFIYVTTWQCLRRLLISW